MSRDYTLRIKYRAGDHPFYNVGTKVFYGDDKAKLQRKLIELMCEYWVISYTIKCTPYSKSYFCEKCQIRKNKVHCLRNKKKLYFLYWGNKNRSTNEKGNERGIGSLWY